MPVSRRLLLAASVSLAACARPVRTPPLALGEWQALQWRSFVDDKLKGQIALGDVRGGDPEAEGWMRKALAWAWGTPTRDLALQDALEDQLRALRLLAGAAQAARYRLDVQLLRVEAEGLVLGAQAQAEVLYRLRERGEGGEGGRLVYERRVRTEGQAGWSDHGLAGGRQRLAKEAALRGSLALLARDLVSLRV